MGWSLAKTVHFKGNSRQCSQGRVWKEGVYGESWTGRKQSYHDFYLPTCQQLNQIGKKGRKAESSTLDFHITYTWDNPILTQHYSCRGFGEMWCLVGAQVGTLGGEQVGPQYLPWWLSLTGGSAIIKTGFLEDLSSATRKLEGDNGDIYEILLFTF